MALVRRNVVVNLTESGSDMSCLRAQRRPEVLQFVERDKATIAIVPEARWRGSHGASIREATQVLLESNRSAKQNGFDQTCCSST